MLTIENILGDAGVDEVEEQTLVNKTTNEQFSVEKVENKVEAGIFTITIKRGIKKTKNWVNLRNRECHKKPTDHSFIDIEIVKCVEFVVSISWFSLVINLLFMNKILKY